MNANGYCGNLLWQRGLTLVPRDEDFAYDPIGNRVSATDYDETGAARTSTYAANNLNQYTARTVPGWASVRGLAAADAAVAVNGNPAYMVGRADPSAPNPDDIAYFFGSDDFDNSAGGGFAELEVLATMSDGTNDLVSVATNRVFVPPANETYAYDADGNMTEDARFRYYWNGENRMIRAEEKSAPPGRAPYVIAYAYDHMGRNVIKDGAKFIWDDYNIIVEDAASSNATFNTWGLDIDGTMQGAGGVGGLLAVEKGDVAYLPVYDANGNITQYLDSDGNIVASYAYNAVGKVVLQFGLLVEVFRHRFSTKCFDSEIGLYYYSYRFYSPSLMRWLARDSIEELGGLNLYEFCENSIPNKYDVLGQYVNIVYDVENKTLTVTDVDGKSAPLTLKGTVVSGNGESCCKKDDQWKAGEGPIPVGKYLIGRSYVPHGHENEHGDYSWYKLYGSNGKGGYDYRNIPVDAPGGTRVYRGGFNLHTGRRSNGCVTVWSDVNEGEEGYPHSDNYDKLKDVLDKTTPYQYKGSDYSGWLEVK